MMEMRNMCFVCLEAILSDEEENAENHHDLFHGEVNQKEEYSFVQILISYVLNSSGSGNWERDKLKLHSEILSSFQKGKLSLCSECLLKAEHLFKLHLELEVIQMRILDVLRELQCDFTRRDSKLGDDISGRDGDGDLFRFRDLLLQGFTRRKLSDKALVRVERFNIAGFKNCPVPVALFPEEEEHPDDDFLDLVNEPVPLSLSTSPVKHELEVEAADDPNGGEWEQACSGNDLRVSPFEEKDDDYDDKETIARTRNSLKRKVTQRRLDARKTKKKSVKPKMETSNKGSDSDSDSDPQRSKDDQGDTDRNYIPENDQDDDDDNASDMRTKTHSPPQIRPKKPGCWDCDICLEYIPPEDFQIHLKTHPEFEKIYTCVLCPPDQVGRAPKRFFGTYKGLVWHYIRCSHNVQLPCKLCPGPGPEQSILYPKSRLCKHLYEVHYPNSNHRKIPCKYINCPKEFYDPISRSQHSRRLHGDGDISCAIICQKKMTSKGGLWVHMKRKHPQGERFHYSSCPRVFNFKKDLRIHVRNYHENPLVPCPHCSRMLHAGTALRRHIKNVHGEKQYQCQFCSLMFPHLSFLKTHEETHGTEKKYLCEQCPYAGTTQKAFRTHMKAVHQERTFKCQQCPKAFVSNCKLQLHQLAHAKEKQYKCEICGAVFTYDSGRTTHLRRVHDVKTVKGKIAEGVQVTKPLRKGLKGKSFKCEYCPETFHSKINCEDHQRIHTGDTN